MYLWDLALGSKEDLRKWRWKAIIFSSHQATPLVQVTSQLEILAICKGSGSRLGWWPWADQNRKFSPSWGQPAYLGRQDGLGVSSSQGASTPYAPPLPPLPLPKLVKTLLASCLWLLCCTLPNRATGRPPTLQRSHLLRYLETGHKRGEFQLFYSGHNLDKHLE